MVLEVRFLSRSDAIPKSKKEVGWRFPNVLIAGHEKIPATRLGQGQIRLHEKGL